ncbi:cyclin-D-binding Myb-like transcription factor 1 [Trichonephila inaurata madagascariensis]|uniref:Cyclin-D-binding Myb-like transcription factor 1 n=1 Tax=Trichonephila inaurata madagascariensis TaxID=2747483 RepID=A0A8X6YIS8_9ARAC|nr:cyclin-D-binding Myb-like transcription factor 1 [Trichonephila inaurata madagascariensis]
MSLVYSINATDENEVDWTLLSKDWSSVRSPQWLRGKWWNLKRHVPNSNVIPFQEICEYLYHHFVMKFKVKEEACTPSSDSLANTLELQAIINRPKEAILQSVTVPATPPPALVVTAAAQGFPSPVVSLTNAQCVDVVNSPHPEVPLTSVTVSPVLQTLLPQNIHLTTTPHSFLLTTPAQQTLPITTALSPNQIIIQTMAVS